MALTGFDSASSCLVEACNTAFSHLPLCDRKMPTVRRGGRPPRRRRQFADPNPRVPLSRDTVKHCQGRGVDFEYALWNCAGLSQERLSYIKHDKTADVTALVELHGDHAKWIAGDRRVNGCAAPQKSDPAAGVALVLSDRAANCILSQGCSESGRIVWVRLAGAMQNTFVVGAYIPHKSRKEPPFQADTMCELDQIIATCKCSGDTVVVMADFNARVARGVQGYTGKWGVHSKPDSGGEQLMELMQTHDLCAASTYFQPPGRAYGRRAQGKVGWGFGNATYIVDKSGKHEKNPAQIDYILVSKRWMSSVKNCWVQWSPSIHRFGYRYDHGMVRMTVRQRLKRPFKAALKSDWLALQAEPGAKRYDEAVAAHMCKQQIAEETSLDEQLQLLYEGMTAGLAALPPKDKVKGKVRERSDATKALFEAREKECAQLVQGSPQWIEMHRSYREQICKSCREDFRNWVQSIVDEIKQADMAGNSSAIAKSVRKLANIHSTATQKSPTRDLKTGRMFEGPADLAQAWADYAADKFSATTREALRGPMPDLKSSKLDREKDVPSDEDLDKCIAALKISKAAGKDGTPIEAYQASPTAKAALFAFTKRLWKEEEVPAQLVLGVFCPLYKKKCVDDMGNYRFICLLSHAYKLLSAYLLLRMVKEAEGFLPDSQAGFRAFRGCRDNVLILAILIDAVIRIGLACVLTFIDFKAAFDSVSHHFLDETLGEAGVSDKCRSIFRAIYAKAAGVVKVRTADGEEVFSEAFPIDRGVLQGDIFSPFCFIAAFALIMKRHDTGGGVNAIQGLVISELEYADDAVTCDEDVETASARVTSICAGAEEAADMEVSAPKTEVMHVARPAPVSPIKEEDIERFAEEGQIGFKCSFCAKPFGTKQGKALHESRWCSARTREVYRKEYAVKKVIGVRGGPRNRFYHVWWEGYLKRDAYWEPSRHLENAADSVTMFWAQHPELSPADKIEVEGEHRCEWCCKIFTPQARQKRSCAARLKLHCSRCTEKPLARPANGETSKRTTRLKRAQRAKWLPKVRMGKHWLHSTFGFTYLGHFFQADGDAMRSVEVRIGKASGRFSKLRWLWDSSAIKQKTKLQLYQSAVVSTLTHCHEAWKLSKKVIKKAGGWNAKCLAIITGRSVRDERVTPSFDIIKELRTRRLRWLGHILRMDKDRLLRKAVVSMEKPYPEGSILMDAPKHDSMTDLIALAGGHGPENHQGWTGMVSEFNEHFIEFPEYVPA